MSTNDQILEQEDPIYLLVKKGQFEVLKDGLAKLKEPHLRRVAAYWLGSKDAMLQPLDDLIALLKESMGSADTLNNVLDRLPKRSCDLLYYILSEGGSLSMDELKAGFPIKDRKGLRDALQPLVVRGLVWELRHTAQDEAGARLFLLSTCAVHLELPSFLEGKLGTQLPHHSREQLQTLVEAFEGDAKLLSRNRETIPWLKSQLRNPVRLRRFIETLELTDRKLLKILALHPQGLTASNLLHEFSLFSQTETTHTLQGILDRLAGKLGLLTIEQAASEPGARRNKEPLYRLPREIAHIIRFNFKEKYHDELRAVPVFLSTDEDFALNSRSKERSTLWIDFQQLLNHLVRCEVGVIRKGGMHKKNLKRILDRMEGRPVDAYHYLDFLFLYAYEREILYPEGERWKINVTNLLPVQNEEAFCWDFWVFYRNNASWNDRDSSPLQGVLQKGNSNFIFSLRRSLLRLLWDCPVNQWIETKVFFDNLMDREESFRNGEIPLVGLDPIREKYRFVKSSLERSLSWLGIVDTTTIPSRRVDLFRVSDIGAWLLTRKPHQSPFTPREEANAITVQNNLEIGVPAGFSLEKQLYLARYTDDHKGRIVVTRASLRRGLEDGLSAREMREFLSDHCPSTLPSNLDHIIQEVVDKTGNIFVGGEPFGLEVSDQVLLDELLGQKKFMPFIQERADAKKAILRLGADVEKLIEELKNAGYSPRVL